MRENHRKQLARLHEARQRAQARVAAHQRGIDVRFDAMERKLTQAEGKSDSTRHKIVTAALELLDEEGLSELSLRKLAAKVNLRAPALYWYFKNKDELLDYMAEAILASEFTHLTPRSNDENWQDWLVCMCQRLRTAMLSHRDGARIVAGAHLYPAVTLAQFIETACESLSTAGLSNDRVDLIVGTAVHFTFGRVIEEQSSPSFEEIKEMDIRDVVQTYPRLARTIERIQATGEVRGFGDDVFEESIRLIAR